MQASLLPDDRQRGLTARQRQVIEMIGRQLCTADIAAALGIAAATVSKHRNHITQKLRLSNTAQLTAYCVQAVSPSPLSIGDDAPQLLAAREW